MVMPAAVWLLAGVLFQVAATPLTTGATLPPFDATTLSEKKVTMPAAAGRTSLLLFGFSREAGDRGRPWTERFDREFTGSAYIVPILEGAPRLIRGFIRGGMKREIPKAMHDRVLLVYQGEKLWKQRLGFQSKFDKEPVVVLIDSAGTIRWLYHGPPDPAKLDAVVAEARGSSAAVYQPIARPSFRGSEPPQIAPVRRSIITP